MTSNVIRKLLVAGACVAALGIVACKPKPAADTAASEAPAASETAPADSSAVASDATAASDASSAPAAQ
ncbi:MAG: hypothetical protein WDM92_12635 [Caulobacteraceae bacterium]